MKLFYNTVTPLLKSVLISLMETKTFDSYRLVGGTALSLQLGHRISIDIDLFSDIEYGTVDFYEIEHFLKKNFKYTDYLDVPPAIGKSYLIGEDRENTIKLDVFYTDTFIQNLIEQDSIRMATIEEIIAMKLEVIQNGGRKKDFWDLHGLLPKYSIKSMLDLHEQRYEYSHDKDLIISNLTDFSLANEDFDPICLLGKHWSFIKEDFIEVVNVYKENNK